MTQHVTQVASFHFYFRNEVEINLKHNFLDIQFIFPFNFHICKMHKSYSSASETNT